MIDVEKLLQTASPERLAVLKERLESDYFDHAKFFLAYREKQPFIVGQHHALIAQTMQRVIDGEITRLLVNMPPSYTKTELIVIQFASFGFALNPGCRFLHISGDKELSLDNSSKIKDQILSPLSLRLWGIQAKDDTDAKGLWKTNKGGAFYARSAGSKLVGFRAGRSKPGFQGALLIDDPQDENEVRSPVKVLKFPDRYAGVIRHRVDNRNTPIIAVMQRLGDEDFSNFLLQGGSGEMWHHLCLSSPVSQIKTTYSHAIPIEHNLTPGPLWEYKHNAEELAVLEKSDVYNYSAQYLQDPHKRGGSVFETSWWNYYSESVGGDFQLLPDFEWKAMFCDTALKDGQQNDYTVFQCWAKYHGKIYLLDQYRGKIKATDLKGKLIEFWNKHRGSGAQPNRGCYIEDKSSGIQLVQDIQKDGGIPVIPVSRGVATFQGKSHTSKLERANNLVNWMRAGLLYLPQGADWLYDYKTEFERFSPLGTHKHDDQIDPTLDAIENMLIMDIQIKSDDKNAKNTALAPGVGAKIW